MQTVILALLIVSSFAADPTPVYNPFIRGGKNDVFLTGDSSRGLASYTFTVPFVQLINPTTNSVIDVFYSIEDIQAQIFSAPDPTDPAYVNVEYAFSTKTISNDHMVTAIYAYLYNPFFRLFTFRYLLFQQGEMWRGTYLVCQNLKFANGSKTAILPLPSMSTSTSSLFEAYFMSNIKFGFRKSDISYGDTLFFVWNSVKSASSSKIELSLIVPSYFDNGYFDISYIGLVIDQTAIQRDFVKYRFKANCFTFQTSHSFELAYFTSVEAQDYHFFGLSSIKFSLRNNDPSFAFTLTENYPNVKLEFIGQSFLTFYNKFAYCYFYFVRLICKPSQPIYDNATLTCSSCSGKTYLNASLVACQPCRYDCLTCQSNYQCKTCDSAAFRVLSTDYSCIAMAGYYQINQSLVQPCVSPCKTCINSASQCTSCVDTTKILISNSCIVCSAIFQGCSNCHITYCISCSVGYTQINSTYCNLPCSDPNCKICLNNDTAYCLLCTFPYKLAGGKCLGTCGNQIVQNGQECDDGNSMLRDGCDADCVVEPNYNCYQRTVSGKIITNYCAYTKAIDFAILTIQKLPHGNIVQFAIQVKEYQQAFWKDSEVLSCWAIDNARYAGMSGRYLQSADQYHRSKLLTPKLSSYSQGSLIFLQFEYLESLQNKPIYLKFDASRSFHSNLVEIPPSIKGVIVIPENNHFAYLYSPEIYSQQQQLSQLFLGLSVLSYILLFASLIVGNKRIVAEYIVLLQIAYASLITLPGYNGMDYSLVALRTANNGFNILEGSAIRPFQDQLSNERIKGMYAYSQLIYNVNVGLIFIFLPLLVGAFASILKCIKSFKEETIKKLEKVQRLSLGEYTFTGLIVGGCSIGLASVLQLQYGKQETDSTLSLISFALPFLLLPLFPIFSIIRFKKPQFFGEYHQALVFTRPSLIFQICVSLLGISSGLLLAFLYSISFANGLVIIFCVLLFVVSLHKRQFKKGLDSFRTQLNLISLMIIQLPFAYTNFFETSKHQSQEDVKILLPICVAVVLSIGLIVNLTFFVYLVVKKIRLYLRQKQQQQLDIKELRTDKSIQSINFPERLNSLKFRKGFIETETEQQYPLQKTDNKDYSNLSVDFEEAISYNSILKTIKPTINILSQQQQACMGAIEQKKFILSTIHKMDEL